MQQKQITATAIRPLPRKEELRTDYGVHTRRCSTCSHWLSRYNPGPICYRHRHADYRWVGSMEHLRELIEEAPNA